MKFEYDDREVEKDCVAMIHKCGSLIIQLERGCVCFDDEAASFYGGENISFWNDTATRRFYPGDKITITF